MNLNNILTVCGEIIERKKKLDVPKPITGFNVAAKEFVPVFSIPEPDEEEMEELNADQINDEYYTKLENLKKLYNKEISDLTLYYNQDTRIGNPKFSQQSKIIGIYIADFNKIREWLMTSINEEIEQYNIAMHDKNDKYDNQLIGQFKEFITEIDTEINGIIDEIKRYN